MEQHPPQPSEYQQYAPQNVYGYQQVVTEKPERNKTVNIGLMLLYIYIGITVLSTALEVVISFATNRYEHLAELQNYDSYSSGVTIDTGTYTAMVITITIIMLVVKVSLMVLFTLMYRAGRTWARILSAVLAILAALQSLWGLISIPFLAAVDPGIVPDYMHSAVVAARDTAIFTFAFNAVGGANAVAIAIFLLKKEASEYTAQYAAWRTYRRSATEHAIYGSQPMRY